MFLQIILVCLSVQLIFGNENSVTRECRNYSCADTILDAAIDLIEKGRNLNKNPAEENGANCIFDLALDLIKNTKLSSTKCDIKAVDCEELLSAGFTENGNYTIWPRSRVNEGKPLNVYCDMQTDGGGWTVIQRRGNFGKPEDYFYKDWSSYKFGFGDVKKDFWLGNDNIFAITSQKWYSVRFDLKAADNEMRFALYDSFWIDDENSNYTLHISDYSGDAGESLMYHNEMQFSTKDKENDVDSSRNCATAYKGAWWYKDCHYSNLNGLYLRGKSAVKEDGITWYSFKGNKETLDTTEIKIRSKTFKKKT